MAIKLLTFAPNPIGDVNENTSANINSANNPLEFSGMPPTTRFASVSEIDATGIPYKRSLDSVKLIDAL